MSEPRVLSFGSLNLDYVYRVERIVRAGETIDSNELQLHCGGKGLNQSIALARAGADVCHAGLVGEDGDVLLGTLGESGVDVSRVERVPGRSGHTIIQVDECGQNSIILYGGANRQVIRGYVERALRGFGSGDVLVVQNEVNMLAPIVELGARRGMRVVLNPSPFDERIAECDLGLVWLMFVNEVEGEQITGESEPERILDALARRWPRMNVVLTLGERGAAARFGDVRATVAAMPVPGGAVVDTTAAGDTFEGYFLAEWLRWGREACACDGAEELRRDRAACAGDGAEELRARVEASLKVAARASAIAVSRAGAAPSIPWAAEVCDA